MSRTSADNIGPGRHIINVGPTQSNLVAGRSARPGEPVCDQNFGGTMNNTFARAATQHDIQQQMGRRNMKTPYFEQAAAPTTTSQNLRGGIGATSDTRGGDAMHSFAALAAKQNQTQDMMGDDQYANQTPQARDRRYGGTSQPMNRSNVHNQSQQSLVGSSGEYQGNAPAGGRPPHQNMFGTQQMMGRTQSAKIDDSTAALGRPPSLVEGLTQFLRKEYYRRMGIYLNGGRKDPGLLLNFWKDHVSETYKKLNQQKKQEQKQFNATLRDKELFDLSRQDPALYRKKMADKEAKDQANLEQHERAEKIQSRQATECRYHKKPVPNCKACERGSQRSSNRPGTATAARRTNSAVPEVKNSTYQDYEMFKNCFELDVVFTINSDLELAAQEEKQEEMNMMQARQKAMENADSKKSFQIVDRMLQLYFLWYSINKPADPIEEEKKNSPSKKAAKPAQPGAAPVKAAVKPGSQPLKAVLSRNQMNDTMKEAEAAAAKRPLNIKENMSLYPKEAVDTYHFFLQLFKLFLREKKIMINDSAAMYDYYLEQKAQFSFPSQENIALSMIRDFFKADKFLLRLNLHREHICKSKTKKQQILKLYYVEIPQRERLINLIDFTPADKQGKDGLAVIQEDEDRQRAAEEAKEKKRQDKILAKLEKDKITSASKKRMNELAKPNDKWKVGKKLLELQKEFPHDRVLQRMVKEEFKANQTFRYPDEYDKFDQEEEKKMKHIETKEPGCVKHDYEAGEARLGTFQTRDMLDLDKEKGKVRVSKLQQIAFEKDLIKEAQAYTVEASKRLDQESGQRKTQRKSLAEIYSKMTLAHAHVVKTQYKLQTYGMKEDSETMKKAYPESFKRYFFRLIKTLNGKRPGQMKNMEVYKGARRLPTTFMVAGTSKRCTIHEVSCPEEPCPYRTHNKKIVMTANLARKQAQATMSTRSRIFYREDFKKQMPKIFMSNDDQINCRFEPMTGSLNPHFWNKSNGPIPEHVKDTADTEKAFCDKMGINFIKSAPEIYKKGVLEKALRKFRGGEFQAALNELMKGFKISQLRRAFDPNFLKKEAKKLQEKEKNKAKTIAASKSGGFMKLDTMKEDPDEQQKNMVNEDMENSKLRGTLKEAYDLVLLIEDQENKCRKEIRKLEVQKKKLKERQITIATLNTIEEQAGRTKELFKTIMCPLIENCPNDCRPRWHKSGERTTTQFGDKCPYAHHYMELQFPQTLKTKISAISKMQTAIRSEVESKKPQSAFIPTGTISDCKGGCFTTKCNHCKYKAMAGLIISDLNDTSIKPTLEAIAMKKKSYNARINAESKETMEYMNTMKTINKELDLDEQYAKKFGLLKKASILSHYRRDKDAKYEIARAATIVANQRKADEEKQEAIQARWKFKLGLDDGFELPEKSKKKHPKEVTDEDLKEVELGPGMTLATVRLYIEKVSPYNNNAYNKNVFLDQCIEDLYLACEGKKIKKAEDIEKMKKNIEGLEEIAELAEQFGEEGVEENLLEEEAQGMSFKPRKTKMCKDILETGRCKLGKTCKLAHNPLQLELIPVTKKIQNLKGVVASQSRLLNQNQASTDWIPPNKHTEMDQSVFEPYIDTKADQADNEENDDKPKSIFEREDLFKDPLDEKD